MASESDLWNRLGRFMFITVLVYATVFVFIPLALGLLGVLTWH